MQEEGVKLEWLDSQEVVNEDYNEVFLGENIVRNH